MKHRARIRFAYIFQAYLYLSVLVLFTYGNNSVFFREADIGYLLDNL
ncbi:hypothetical protein HMPREF9447_00688 [Bacteroides oleiciplenus YIT 12058]|jgi:hypothetical protein|uniref:Uncharacterized protein n=1 Tax=Bacteroides oleiciplenus YIT 12058 TaxID=742727 RepID=K9E6F0_9BACE|nr:hypothetical protein HMPREF9447_00688 [Bacteroides oleiciplenus YIT 12058]